ncbi:hypothetical protein, partial [Clostridium tarantellae]|uniref:hypothetical protein n=1 Tax=Clostridium tarantellae TaxID=39493 RepID=UPI001479177A
LALSKGKKENEYEVNKIKLDFKSEIEELETEHEQMLEEKETEIKNIVYKKDAELKQAFQVNFNDKSKIKELTLELSKIKKEKEIEFNNYKINIKSEMKDLENEYEEIIQKKEAEVKKLSYANLECKKIIEELEVSKNKFNNKEKEYMKKIEVLEKEINELNLKINNSIKEEKKAKILTVKEKIDIKIDSATALSILSSNLGFIAKTDKGLKAVLQKEFDSFEIFKIDLNNSVKEGNCIKISRNIKKLIELVENISNKIKLYSIDLPNSNEDIIKDFKKIDNLVN